MLLTFGITMAHVSFTRNIQRHVNCPPLEAGGKTVSQVLANVFQQNPQAESYVVDERGALRKHMVIFVERGQSNGLRNALG